MTKLYTYHGTISSMTAQNGTAREIILHDLKDDDKAPTRLSVWGGLAKYIHDLEGTDAEERYMDSDYYFDRNLTLVRIEVPSITPGIPAKVITQRADWDTEPIIFGPSEYVEDPEPEQMDKEQLAAWLKWKYNR